MTSSQCIVQSPHQHIMDLILLNNFLKLLQNMFAGGQCSASRHHRRGGADRRPPALRWQLWCVPVHLDQPHHVQCILISALSSGKCAPAHLLECGRGCAPDISACFPLFYTPAAQVDSQQASEVDDRLHFCCRRLASSAVPQRRGHPADRRPQSCARGRDGAQSQRSVCSQAKLIETF